MTITITLDNWTVQKESARAVRLAVFVVEQKIPKELEWDDMDAVSLHVVARDASGQAIGTGRLLPDGHIGRMAVLATARNTGVGGLILERLMLAAQQRGDQRLMLSAQISAVEFYARYGFQKNGPEYLEAGIPHVNMEKSFGQGTPNH